MNYLILIIDFINLSKRVLFQLMNLRNIMIKII